MTSTNNISLHQHQLHIRSRMISKTHVNRWGFVAIAETYQSSSRGHHLSQQVVFRSALVDIQQNEYQYGTVFAFKDYSDRLYITVSLNATGFGPPSLQGQLLHASPSLFNPVEPSGVALVWGTALPIDTGANYYSDAMLFWPSIGIWSCFTYIVDLKKVCNHVTSKAGSSMVRGQRAVGLPIIFSPLSPIIRLDLAAGRRLCRQDNWNGVQRLAGPIGIAQPLSFSQI